jgi:ATP-dependent Clp protease ATP-binding subunit ClpB
MESRCSRNIQRPVKGATLMVMIDARLEELRRQIATINLKLAISDRAQGHLPTLLVQEGVRTAQHMERWIRSQVIQPLATLLLTTDVPQNSVVALDIDDFDQLSVRLQEGQASSPPSPASSYYSLSTVDGDGTYSHVESVSSESEFVGSYTQLDPIVRSGLQAQPQPIF